jgi:hypothetical protein
MSNTVTHRKAKPDQWSAPLSTDLDTPEAVPYFLWDEPMTVQDLRRRLDTASIPEKARLLGKILREARDWEVWKFTTPEEVARMWPKLVKHLGRRRSFWEFLLDEWRQQGRLAIHVPG